MVLSVKFQPRIQISRNCKKELIDFKFHNEVVIGFVIEHEFGISGFHTLTLSCSVNYKFIIKYLVRFFYFFVISENCADANDLKNLSLLSFDQLNILR